LREKVTLFEDFENRLWERGLSYVAGVDEAGLGALAGPVVAAAVIFKPHEAIEGVNDSKKLTPLNREKLAVLIKEKALYYSIGIVDIDDIDRIGNIFEVGLEAMARSIKGLKVSPDHILVDGREISSLKIPQTNITKGDSRSFSIAAASILAKVHRDNLMIACSESFKEYKFSKHKGYATAAHIKAIKEQGPCSLHRMSYDFVKGLCGEFSKEYYMSEENVKVNSDPIQLKELAAKVRMDDTFSELEKDRLKKRIKSRIKYLENRRR
jgi:ribonuclease HII